jgi:hypothetical protein
MTPEEMLERLLTRGFYTDRFDGQKLKWQFMADVSIGDLDKELDSALREFIVLRKLDERSMMLKMDDMIRPAVETKIAPHRYDCSCAACISAELQRQGGAR